jgi:inorganic pyrophosphatase
MSSNSIAVMPKPTYETWFMEGTLVGDYHYIEIKKDYSDLEEKLNYYIEHTNEALKIIENAHTFVGQFQNKECEKLISLLVLQKYFHYVK